MAILIACKEAQNAGFGKLCDHFMTELKNVLQKDYMEKMLLSIHTY